MRKRNDYQAWLWGEILLFGLLGAALALFLAYPELRHSYRLPELRLVLDTTIALAAGIVAVLTGVRFSVEGRRVDLALSCGFFVASAATILFAIVPVVGGTQLHLAESWAEVGGRLLAAALIAVAPLLPGRVRARERWLGNGVLFLVVALGLVWAAAKAAEPLLPDLAPGPADDLPLLLIVALACEALLALVALVGFGIRFRNHGEDLDGWLASAAALTLFSALYHVFTPLLASTYVSEADFLRVLAYGVLLAGVWRAIRFAEFGRAVAEERARVAREVHDGLAQYLFAIATHASMLENGAPREETIQRIKDAASSAQQEARFAVLALSSASGTAPFDAALRRYVDFLTADGSLEVDVEIDHRIELAPDEQIEVFRIVQEGLANVRKHAGASRAEVRVGRRGGERFVAVRDNGSGFEAEQDGAGQGLKNIRARAASIAGAASVRSKPGQGTAIEVVLRT